MIWSIAPVSASLKARNGEPGSALIATGAPVIAACFAGSVYIAKRLSAGAGRDQDRIRIIVVKFDRAPGLDHEPLRDDLEHRAGERAIEGWTLDARDRVPRPSRAIAHHSDKIHRP